MGTVRVRAQRAANASPRPSEPLTPRHGDAGSTVEIPSPRRPVAATGGVSGALVLGLLLSIGACASTHPATPLFHAQGAHFGHPARDSIRNANGSPRAISDADYAAFWRDIAPRLRDWSGDPRLALNPAFLAALLAKESAFSPRAVSPSGALGIAQLTVGADTDLRTRAGTPFFAWMLPEIQAWPRDTAFRSLTAAGPATLSAANALAADSAAAARDYLFDPVLAVRAATFWLRMLETVWTTDTWPGAYGALARDRLNGGRALTEQQLLELAVVSYNQGVEYARGLVERWGPAWTQHLDAEPADYLERIRAYTMLFQH